MPIGSRMCQYSGKTLSDSERENVVGVINETIAFFSEGLPMMNGTLDNIRNLEDE